MREVTPFEVIVICCGATPSAQEREVLRSSMTDDEERRRARFVRCEDAVPARHVATLAVMAESTG